MDEELKERLNSIEDRLGKIEEAVQTINYELGILCGKMQNSSLLLPIIKFVIFPLIIVVGAVVGVKLVWPG